MQLPPHLLIRTASDGPLGDCTLLFTAPCQYWTGVLPEPRVEGLGPLERRPGRPGMQPNIEILNAPAPQQGSSGQAITPREVRPGAHPTQALSTLSLLPKASLPGCRVMQINPLSKTR